MSDTVLSPSLERALDARRELIARLEAEQTNAYRLFHGTVEGRPGLTVDHYGQLILVQSFHATLPASQLAEGISVILEQRRSRFAALEQGHADGSNDQRSNVRSDASALGKKIREFFGL